MEGEKGALCGNLVAGALVRRGYDFIQTDWLLACGQFLASTGRRRQ